MTLLDSEAGGESTGKILSRNPLMLSKTLRFEVLPTCGRKLVNGSRARSSWSPWRVYESSDQATGACRLLNLNGHVGETLPLLLLPLTATRRLYGVNF